MSEASAPLLVHVGYHKTATTWMQQRLFVAEHGYAQVAGHADADREIVRPHPLVFDPKPARERLGRGRADCPAGHCAVLSSEILSGNPFVGARDSVELAMRLRDIAPEGRILVTIRDQLSLLPSLYMQTLRRGSSLTPQEFFDGSHSPGYLGFDPLHLEYDRLIERYQSLFGPDRVLVVTQESLRDDRDRVLDQLANFAGNTAWRGLRPGAETAVGASYPEGAAPALRRINHFQRAELNQRPVITLGVTPRGPYRWVGAILRRLPPVASRKPVRDYVVARYSGHYVESNRRLAVLCPEIDLTGYQGIARSPLD